MALSEQEQRLLDEMERSLYQHDADVVSPSRGGEFTFSARAITICVLSLAVGLGIVIVSMMASLPFVGLLGFVVMVGGTYWAFTATKPDAFELGEAPAPNRPSGKPQGNGFMDRLEERWERRKDERGH